MGKKKGAYPTTLGQGVLGIPHPIWEELWEEADRAKALFRRFQEAPSPELERELLGSLTHLMGHVSAMWEEAEFQEDREEA